MNRRIAVLFGGAIVLIAIAFAAWVYRLAPPVIPAHFDSAGHPNGYLPKLYGIGIYPAIAVFVWAIMLVLPGISPKGFRLGQSVDVYYLIFVAILIFMLILEAIVLRAALGMAMPPAAFTIVLIGVLFAIVGNVMAKIHKNFFFGIRTPWTLASDEVWLRTHRFGGWVFAIGGLVFVAMGSFGYFGAGQILAVALVMALLPVAYSYVAYRQIEGFDSNGT